MLGCRTRADCPPAQPPSRRRRARTLALVPPRDERIESKPCYRRLVRLLALTLALLTAPGVARAQRHVRLQELSTALAPLFPCPTGTDAFAARRCRSTLSERRRALRDEVLVTVAPVAVVGPYDFRRHRFALTIYGFVAVSDDRGEEPFLVSTAPLSPATLGRMSSLDDLPRSAVVARSHIAFESDEEAEAWFRTLPNGGTLVGNDPDRRLTSVVLLIQARRGWTQRLPETRLARLLRRQLNRGLARAGVRHRSPVQREVVRGATIRVVGWIAADNARVLGRGLVGRQPASTAALLDRLTESATRHLGRPGEPAQRSAEPPPPPDPSASPPDPAGPDEEDAPPESPEVNDENGTPEEAAPSPEEDEINEGSLDALDSL